MDWSIDRLLVVCWLTAASDLCVSASGSFFISKLSMKRNCFGYFVVENVYLQCK